MQSRFPVPGALLLVTIGLFAAGCTEEQKDKAGQTTTTAASAAQEKVERATSDAKQELKREWRDLDVHVTSASDAGAPTTPQIHAK